MEITNFVLQVLTTITGLDASDFLDNPDLDLIENGILDSLTVAFFLHEISAKFGTEFTFQDFSLSDFQRVDSIIAALSKKLP